MKTIRRNFRNGFTAVGNNMFKDSELRMFGNV